MSEKYREWIESLRKRTFISRRGYFAGGGGSTPAGLPTRPTPSAAPAAETAAAAQASAAGAQPPTPAQGSSAPAQAGAKPAEEPPATP